MKHYVVQVSNKAHPSNQEGSSDWRDTPHRFDDLGKALRHARRIEDRGVYRYARVEITDEYYAQLTLGMK